MGVHSRSNPRVGGNAFVTLSAADLAFFGLGMAGLWAVPGPVWVALLARALSGGFAAAWPLALGVTLGDCLWPTLAIFGMGWVLSQYGEALHLLRWIAGGTLAVMGALLIIKSGALMSADSKLTRPGRLAGLLTGLAAVLGNPKAILFYMTILPGFFGDLSRLTGGDIAAILAVSVAVPLAGNLGLALFLDRARAVLSSPARVQILNRLSGLLLILVACVIPFT
jgi:threonine/homoserine/homoserine lactone efflux protein